MAQTSSPIKFLLNRGVDEVVKAPAFSLTKVLQTAALVLTPLVTLLVSALPKISFSPGQVVTLTVAVLALLAVTGSADVLARGMATSADKFATSADKRAEAASATPCEQALSRTYTLVLRHEFRSLLEGRGQQPCHRSLGLDGSPPGA